jgi:heme-degrading monooxygenase HmoA
MVSRIVTCTIDPSKAIEFKTVLNEIFLPRIQAQPGFVDNIEAFEPATGKFCCVTLWKSAADVDNYDNGLFKEVAANLGALMTDSPHVQTLPVENSSVHHVKAGRAAA